MLQCSSPSLSTIISGGGANLCLCSRALLLRCNSYGWKTGNMPSIAGGSLNLYVELLMTFTTSNRPRFLWSSDLFGRVVFICLASNITMSPALNSGAGCLLLLACSVYSACIYVSCSRRYFLSSLILATNISATLISLFALCVVVLSYSVVGSTPDLGTYPFVTRNGDRLVVFWSVFALNLVMGKKLTQLVWLQLINAHKYYFSVVFAFSVCPSVSGWNAVESLGLVSNY